MSVETSQQKESQNPQQELEQDLELAARIAKRVTKESDRFRVLIGKLPDRHARDTSVEL